MPKFCISLSDVCWLVCPDGRGPSCWAVWLIQQYGFQCPYVGNHRDRWAGKKWCRWRWWRFYILFLCLHGVSSRCSGFLPLSEGISVGCAGNCKVPPGLNVFDSCVSFFALTMCVGAHPYRELNTSTIKVERWVWLWRFYRKHLLRWRRISRVTKQKTLWFNTTSYKRLANVS